MSQADDTEHDIMIPIQDNWAPDAFTFGKSERCTFSVVSKGFITQTKKCGIARTMNYAGYVTINRIGTMESKGGDQQGKCEKRQCDSY